MPIGLLKAVGTVNMVLTPAVVESPNLVGGAHREPEVAVRPRRDVTQKVIRDDGHAIHGDDAGRGDAPDGQVGAVNQKLPSGPTVISGRWARVTAFAGNSVMVGAAAANRIWPGPSEDTPPERNERHHDDDEDPAAREQTYHGSRLPCRPTEPHVMALVRC